MTPVSVPRLAIRRDGQRRPYAFKLEWRLEARPIIDASLEQ
jgi:hypothetical protein